MNENTVMQEGEISLFDLLGKVRDGWAIVFGGLVLGLVAAVLACFLLPTKFESVALIQVGQIGHVDQDKVSSLPVEAPVQAIERMKTPSFQLKVAEELKDQSWVQRITDADSGTTKDLSMQVIKSTVSTVASSIPLIELRATGNSTESARQKAEAMVAQLAKTHDEQMQPALAFMRSDLAINREKLASAERNLAELTNMVAGVRTKDDRFTQLALMSSLRVQKETEVFGLRKTITILETALGAPATQPTKVIETIFASDRPIAPKKALLLSIGAIGGLLAGVLCVFVVDALLQRRRSFRSG